MHFKLEGESSTSNSDTVELIMTYQQYCLPQGRAFRQGECLLTYWPPFVDAAVGHQRNVQITVFIAVGPGIGQIARHTFVEVRWRAHRPSGRNWSELEGAAGTVGTGCRFPAGHAAVAVQLEAHLSVR